MRRYGEWGPTTMDAVGLGLEDRQHWWVLGITRTRDSGPHENSQFLAALKLLGGEADGEVEVRRFGHWGPGWFEVILIDPNAPGPVLDGLEVERRLADGDTLDEGATLEALYEDYLESWEGYGRAELIEALVEELGLLGRTRGLLRDCDSSRLRGWYEGMCEKYALEIYEERPEGAVIRPGRVAGLVGRDDVLRLVQSSREQARKEKA